MVESLPLGVYVRKDSGRLYFELRASHRKFYSCQIQSRQEGALCHDIMQLYIGQLKIGGGPGGKRKALQGFNYPEYSSTLVLDDLSEKEFSEKKGDVVMNAVLRQARVAARAMPEQEHATRRPKAQKQDVCSRSGHKSSSSKKDACSSSRGVKGHLDSAGDHTANDCGKRKDDAFEHVIRFSREYELKVSEREELERKVKDMTEGSGLISLKKPGSDKFHEHVARFKQLVSNDGCKCSSWVEPFEQKYMSEEYKCIKLRKELEGHNMKSIPESLMCDGNTTTGRRRENESRRLSPVLGIFPTAEQNSCSADEVSNFSAPPASTPVLDLVVPYVENDSATPSTVESDLSEPVALYAFALGDKYTDEDMDKFWSTLANGPIHTGCRRENENAMLEELCAYSNDEKHSQIIDTINNQEFQDRWSPDWSNDLFQHLKVSFSIVDSIPLQNPPSI